MKLITRLLFAALLSIPVVAVSTKSNACTNSYDKASDGSSCGGRASGCKSGGKSGYC